VEYLLSKYLQVQLRKVCKHERSGNSKHERTNW